MNYDETKQQFIKLYKDESFKNQFKENYAAHGIGDELSQQQFTYAFNLIHAGGSIPGWYPLLSCSPKMVKQAFLVVSKLGLSFLPSDKEVYIIGKNLNSHTLVEVKLGYKGIQALLSRSSQVKLFSSELVYETDTFKWLGPNKAPVIVSDGQSSGKIVCGYTIFNLTDGTVLVHKMTEEELAIIQEQDIQIKADIGNGEKSLYETAWRDRNLRIAMLRCAFNEYKHLLLSKRSNGVTLEDDSSVSLTEDKDDFEKTLMAIKQA